MPSGTEIYVTVDHVIFSFLSFSFFLIFKLLIYYLFSFFTERCTAITFACERLSLSYIFLLYPLMFVTYC